MQKILQQPIPGKQSHVQAPAPAAGTIIPKHIFCTDKLCNGN